MTLVNLPLKRIKIAGHVCKCNSTTTPLLAGETFTGDWENIADYGTAFIAVKSDKESATDGLKIEQSSDAVNADHDDVYTIPAATGKNFSINPHSKWMRVKYTNGGEDQTYFRLSTILKGNSKPSSHRIQDSISSDDDATLTKSVITGETPTPGTFTNFKATALGNFRVAIDEYGDTPSIDGFGNLRVSEQFTLWDLKQLHDKQPLFIDEIVNGSATSVQGDSCTLMSVTASATDYVIRQAKQRPNYQPGKAQKFILSFNAPTAEGVKQRIGLFDGTGGDYMTPNNGFYFENDGGTLSFNICKNGVVTETLTQANWNVDTLDGNGSSGITLDMDALQLIVGDMEWLGAGRLRLGFVIGGILRYACYFNHSNDPTFDSVYTATPNLPVRYDIQSDGTSAGTLKHICGTVISEGGIQQIGIQRSVFNATHVDANVVGTIYAMLGIRLKTTYIDITLLPEYVSTICLTNDDFLWLLLLNPTIAGTFTYNDITNSSFQVAYGALANTIIAGAYDVCIDSGFSKASAAIDRRINTSLRLGSTIAGVRDTLVLAVIPISGSNADYYSSLTVRELL